MAVAGLGWDSNPLVIPVITATLTFPIVFHSQIDWLELIVNPWFDWSAYSVIVGPSWGGLMIALSFIMGLNGATFRGWSHGYQPAEMGTKIHCHMTGLMEHCTRETELQWGEYMMLVTPSWSHHFRGCLGDACQFISNLLLINHQMS